MAEATQHYPYSQLIHALDSAGAVKDGPWIETHPFKSVTIHVKGTFVGTVQVRGSCDFETFAAGSLAVTDDEIQIGADITAPGIITLVYNSAEDVLIVPAYLKVMCSAWTSGTIDAYLVGRY